MAGATRELGRPWRAPWSRHSSPRSPPPAARPAYSVPCRGRAREGTVALTLRPYKALCSMRVHEVFTPNRRANCCTSARSVPEATLERRNMSCSRAGRSTQFRSTSTRKGASQMAPTAATG
jgi:hypothetical protein